MNDYPDIVLDFMKMIFWFFLVAVLLILFFININAIGIEKKHVPLPEYVIQCFQNNRQHIAHIQFADCPGRHEPDTAELNFTGFFQAIAQSGYTGFVAAEYVPSQISLQSLQWKQRYFPSETM